MIDASPPPARRGPGWRRARRVELRAAAVTLTVLVVSGLPLGLAWAWWSPPGPRALLYSGGQIQPEESEAFVAGDGRFALICLVAGLLAGLLAWLAPAARAARGTIVLLALAVGGVVGSAITVVVGTLAGGGSDSGRPGTVVAQLPLRLHTPGLLLLEAAAAVLVYGLCVSFTASDDLGRPDPERVLARVTGRPRRAEPPAPLP